jgi:PPM family protein phosphatase
LQQLWESAEMIWQSIKNTYKNKFSILITGIVIALVGAFWILAPKPLSYQHYIDISASFLLVCFSVLFPLTINSYFDQTHKVQEVQTELRESNLVKNEISCLSDIGKVRELDEDSVFVAKIFSTVNGISSRKALLMVCDGMGGHSKGEVASCLASLSVAKEIVPELLAGKSDYKTLLSNAVSNANTQVLNYATENPVCEGMGTTMTVAIADQNNLQIAHVGDTRAYLVSNSQISQLTKDHSYVQELVDKGEITKEEAKRHPQKNVITRVVGVYADVIVDVYGYRLQSDAQLLMCCDGLVNHVNDNEIKDIVQSSLMAKKACASLIDLANSRGGKDNISVVLTPVFSNLFPINEKTQQIAKLN